MAAAAAEIRRAAPEERARILEVSRRTIRAAYGPILGQSGVDRYAASAEHDAYFDTQADTTFVITDGGAVAGVSVLRANMVDLLLIDPEHQGKGLGTLLLAAMEAELFRDFDPIALESWKANSRANRFWLERGWTTIGETADERTGAPKLMFMKGRT